MTESGGSATGWATVRATGFLLAVVSSLVLVACGGAATATTSTASAAPASTSTPAPSPPPGGPVPSQLIGDWNQLDATPAVAPVLLSLTAGSYTIRSALGQGQGSVVVNGDEIDFFSSNLCLDHPLPDGVGRYRWTLQGATLHFAPLNADPCGRIGYLTNTSYSKG